jgi:hypothetical protein
MKETGDHDTPPVRTPDRVRAAQGQKHNHRMAAKAVEKLGMRYPVSWQAGLH